MCRKRRELLTRLKQIHDKKIQGSINAIEGLITSYGTPVVSTVQKTYLKVVTNVDKKVDGVSPQIGPRTLPSKRIVASLQHLGKRILKETLGLLLRTGPSKAH